MDFIIFVNGENLNRLLAVGEISKEIVIKNRASISEKYSGFFIIGLESLIYKLREETNDTSDFMEFLAETLTKGGLPRGSLLIMDNTPIQGGVEAVVLITEMLEEYGVELVYLPTYSPELNPIFFAYIKQRFYRSRDYSKPFLEQLIGFIEGYPIT